MASLYEAANKDQQSQIPASQEGVDGLRAFLQKDWQTAKTNFEKCAERAEGVCLNNLGVIFENGLGVVSDKQKAFEYYKRAADSGLTLGVYNYGRALTLSFNGTTADSQKGISLYKQAAEAGSAQAMGLLAELSQMPATKTLITSANIIDQELLFDYAKISNAFNNSSGMLALGYMYLNGYSGVDKNQGLAKINFEKAANFGNVGGFIALGKMAAENGNQIEADNYFDRAFKISPIATSTLLGYYGVKDSPAYDPQKAVHWAKKGAYAGVTGAMANYGIYLTKGVGGLTVNETEGPAWIYVAKLRGNKVASDLVEKNWSNLSQAEKDAILAKAKDIDESIPNFLGIVAAPN
jgi:TPR repeat protein